MMSSLEIYINQQQVYEHHSAEVLDKDKLAFLDKMDHDMARGIKIQGQLVEQPVPEQKARFVTLNLLRALQQDNDAAINVSCTYLQQRMPELTQVHINDGDKGIDIEFVF